MQTGRSAYFLKNADFHAPSSLGFTENGHKNMKNQVSSNSESVVGGDALLMKEVGGEWLL